MNPDKDDAQKLNGSSDELPLQTQPQDISQSDSLVNPTSSSIAQEPTKEPQAPTNPSQSDTSIVSPDSTPSFVNGQSFSSSPTVSQPTPSQALPPQKTKRSKKPFIIAGLAVLALALLSGGYVYGYYIPNKPENVWKTGIDRSGDVLEKLVTESTSEENFESFKNSKVTGSLAFESGTFKASGSLDTRFNESRSDTDFKLKIEGEEEIVSGKKELDLGLNLKTSLDQNKRFPDIFFRVSGLKELEGLGLLSPTMTEYDSKWIAVTSEYLEAQLPPAAETDTLDFSPAEQLSAEEVSEIGQAVNKTLQEYVFNSDESKSIIKQKEFVGKEKLNDIKTYHYKAGFNAGNIAPFCKAMVENVMSTSGVVKFFNGDAAAKDEAKDEAIKSCNESVENEDIEDLESYTFDLWMDAKYKLIHKLRFTEEGEPGFVDFGQRYTGGDEVIFFTEVDTEDLNFKSDLNINLESKKTTLRAEAVGKSDSEDIKFNMSITIESHSGDIDGNRPDGAVDIQEIENKLYNDFNDDGIPDDALPDDCVTCGGSSNGVLGLFTTNTN